MEYFQVNVFLEIFIKGERMRENNTQTLAKDEVLSVNNFQKFSKTENRPDNNLVKEFTNKPIPLEVHIFEYENEFFVFDVRNYAILKLDAAGALVLSHMHKLPLDELINALSQTLSKELIRSYYKRFLALVNEGVFSLKPIRKPNTPEFNRLVLMLAGGCNMGCTYCFEKDVPIYQNPNLLSQEKADEILNWFFEHQEGSKAHIQLYGGEALLNWNVLKYVVSKANKWAIENDIDLTKYLITNGTLLKEDRIAFLKDNNVTIQVSVDGDAETHNRFRIFKSGQPTIDRIKPNIEKLNESGADFNLRAVLTRQNKDPQAVIDGLRTYGAEKVSFEVVATDDLNAQFDDKDWDEFNDQYLNFVHNPFISWAKLPDEMQTMIIRICEGQKVFYGCGAGKSEVTIAPDGNIYECQRIYRKPYSNINEDKSPLELASTFLTMVDERPVCKDCWARYLCGGGCLHQSQVGHGIDDPLPQYCTMKHNLAEASIVKIHQIRSMNADNNQNLEDKCTTVI